MSRVLIPPKPDYYEELKAVSYYSEADLERSIRQHAKLVFPDYYVFPFKANIKQRSSNVKKKPDLAMVRHDLKEWGLIEVELATHSISHILSQTNVFKDGAYNAPDLARYLAQQMQQHCKTNFTERKLYNLIRRETPKILVVLDAHEADTIQKLNKAGVSAGVFQIFKNCNGSYAYRTIGDFPIFTVKEAYCRRHPKLTDLFEIVGRFTFKRVGKRREIDIRYGNSISRWVILSDGGKNYIRSVGVNPLSQNATYLLYADKRHNYYLVNN